MRDISLRTTRGDAPCCGSSAVFAGLVINHPHPAVVMPVNPVHPHLQRHPGQRQDAVKFFLRLHNVPADPGLFGLHFRQGGQPFPGGHELQLDQWRRRAAEAAIGLRSPANPASNHATSPRPCNSRASVSLPHAFKTPWIRSPNWPPSSSSLNGSNRSHPSTFCEIEPRGARQISPQRRGAEVFPVPVPGKAGMQAQLPTAA